MTGFSSSCGNQTTDVRTRKSVHRATVSRDRERARTSGLRMGGLSAQASVRPRPSDGGDRPPLAIRTPKESLDAVRSASFRQRAPWRIWRRRTLSASVRRPARSKRASTTGQSIPRRKTQTAGPRHPYTEEQATIIRRRPTRTTTYGLQITTPSLGGRSRSADRGRGRSSGAGASGDTTRTKDSPPASDRWRQPIAQEASGSIACHAIPFRDASNNVQRLVYQSRSRRPFSLLLQARPRSTRHPRVMDDRGVFPGRRRELILGPPN